MVLVFSRGVSAQCGHTNVYSCGVESSVFATSVAPVYEFAIVGVHLILVLKESVSSFSSRTV